MSRVPITVENGPPAELRRPRVRIPAHSPFSRHLELSRFDGVRQLDVAPVVAVREAAE